MKCFFPGAVLILPSQRAFPGRSTACWDQDCPARHLAVEEEEEKGVEEEEEEHSQLGS